MSQVLASSCSLWFPLPFADLATAPPGVSDRLCLPPSAFAVFCCVAVAEQLVGSARLGCSNRSPGEQMGLFNKLREEGNGCRI